jgi:hypothetical protein
MNSYKSYAVIIAMFVAMATSLETFAQDNWEKPAGGIENAQVVIEKDKIISLRPVSRRFKAIQLEIPQAKPLAISYQLKDTPDSLPSLQVIVRPKTMKDQELDKFYGLNAKVGGGNYKSAYALINASTKRNDEYYLNGYFNHYSSGTGPVHGSMAGEWTTIVGGSGKYFLNNATLYSNINFKNHTYGIYGYDADESATIIGLPGLKQKLNIVSFDVGFTDNNLKNHIDHDLNLGINFLANNYDYSEFIFDVNYMLKAELDDSWSISTGVDFTLISQNALGVSDYSRKYGQLKPVISYKLNQFVFRAGINVNHVSDIIIEANNLSQFRFFPLASIDYGISTKHNVKIALEGGVEKVSLNSILEENPYISQDILVNNNISDFVGLVNLEGEIATNLGYKLGYLYKHYDRMMFYKNNTLDTARFDVVYDEGGASLNKFSLNLSYAVNDNLNFSAGGAYNIYNTIDLFEAWHRPTFEIDFGSNFIIAKKLHGHITYFLLNGIIAENSTGQIKTLDTIHDLNVGLNLLLTERAGIFIDVMNIFGSNYQMYNNYPVKGFQVVGGLSFKF